MTIYLMRHGNAEMKATTDRERGLTETGRTEVQSVMTLCAPRLQGIQAIWVSPYRRAQETLAVAKEYLPAVPAEHCDFLTPSSDPLDVLVRLQHSGLQDILLISHQPLVGTLLDDLCNFEPGRYRMGTASLAAVAVDDVVARGMGELKWLKHP